MKVTVSESASKPTTFWDMKIGQVGRILGGNYDGEIVLRAYGFVVSLSDPQNSWSDCPPIPVHIFPEGTKITLVVE